MVFASLALVSPGVLLPLNYLWGVFASRLGLFNNYVLLGLFFFLLVFPIGVVMRALGNDPMRHKLEPKTAIYWRPVGRDANAETFKDMF